MPVAQVSVMMQSQNASIEETPKTTEMTDVLFTLEQEEAEIVVGNTFILLPVFSDGNVYEVTFASSDGNVAMVNANGVVTAVSAGSATIEAKCEQLGHRSQ